MEKKDDLEHQIWYHGFRPRKEVEALLTSAGDFLVRATDAHAKPEIILSYVNSKKKINHLILKFDNALKKWHIGVLKNKDKGSRKIAQFDTIVQLVEYYKDHRIGKDKLTRQIPRPTYHIKHDKVEFNKTTNLLGSGNFCHVYKGTYTSQTDKITVAIKICHEGQKAGQENNDESREARNQMLCEAQLMSYYSHEFVVKLYGVACDHPPVLIVMEFCPGGDLVSHLIKAGDAIEVGERIVYAFEAARGMRYLHKNQCVHRDLAARNCLISAQGTIKIADFGLSRLVREIEVMREEGIDESKDIQIPVRGMAPESLKKPLRFSVKSDVWAYGVLLYEIFNNGVKMWPDDHPKKVATAIRRGNMMAMPAITPPEIQELTKNIWQVDPEKRPSMFNICKKLDEIRACYPPPEPEKFAINNPAKGVTRVPVAPDEGPSQEQDDRESAEEKTSDGNSQEKSVEPKEPRPIDGTPVVDVRLSEKVTNNKPKRRKKSTTSCTTTTSGEGGGTSGSKTRRKRNMSKSSKGG